MPFIGPPCAVPVVGPGGTALWSLVSDRDFPWASVFPWHYERGYATHKHLRLHRIVLDTPKGMETDHINRDRLDNRRENLRVVTRAENSQNLSERKQRKHHGRRGVCWDKSRQKWCAQVRLNYKRYNLGRFDTEQEAAAVVAAFRAEHMPFSEEAR